MQAKNATIIVRDVEFQYNALTVLRNFSHTFHKARIYPIVGNNGSGKSTLLHILAGLLSPQKGNVFLSKQAMYPHTHLLKGYIGFSGSKSFLCPHLTIVENLELLGLARHIHPDALLERIQSALSHSHLTAEKNQLVKTLSDGYLKRATLAQSIVHDPQILILDEPCALLDPTQREYLWTFIKELHLQGKSVIFSTHHDKEAHYHFGTIYQLQKSQLFPITNSHECQIISNKEAHAISTPLAS